MCIANSGEGSHVANCKAEVQNKLEKENIMKTLVTAVALATLIATPVLAQTIKPAPRAKVQVQQSYPQFRTTHKQHSTNPAYDVYDTAGNYLGSDPDPTIRTMILTDQGSSE